MLLADGYADIARGKLANIETRLEMLQRPKFRADPPRVSFEFELLPAPVDIARYLALFRRVGEPWLWFSRLKLSEEKLGSILNDQDVELYALRDADEDAGILELDFRKAGECELSFFGVVEQLVGRGAGRWMMNRAIEYAWRRPIERFWVHTCTLDHPRSVEFYMRSGFVPYERAVEVTDDPRVSGLLSRDAAPGVPII